MADRSSRGQLYTESENDRGHPRGRLSVALDRMPGSRPRE
jgi:hypothetical protein